ncbi:MAG: hypothetical protein CMG26_00620 [Candidatus Marinimicrobia bacterium]|nr:hypothetical protein [Candidatus Neomarinimicrobiota bacterium]
MRLVRMIFLILLISSFLLADYAGGYPGSILRHGVSARDIALSGATIASYEDGFTSFSNPAMISMKKQLTIGSSLFLLPNKINMQAFSIGRNLPPNAGASLSFIHFGTSNILSINQNEEFLEQISFHDSYAMMSFGINFSQYFSIGMNAKMLFQRYNLSNNDKISSDGISLDLGILSSISENLNIGIKVDNFSGHYKWGENKNIIPMRIISGISYYPSELILIAFQHEMIDLDKDFLSSRLSGGGEYKFNYKNPVFIRLGIKQANWAIINNEKKGLLIQPSAGLGLEFESFNKSIFKLDYALEFNKLGVTNLISLAIKL